MEEHVSRETHAVEADQAGLEDGPSLEGQELVSEPDLELVFVYGSLKRDQSNHDLLSAPSFQGEARAPGLVLHDLGPFPMAIAAEPIRSQAVESPGDNDGRSGFQGDAGIRNAAVTQGERKAMGHSETWTRSQRATRPGTEDRTELRADHGFGSAAASARSGHAASPSIAGEVYAVDGETLAQLDRLEGVPRLYQRQRMQLLDGRQAWVYLGQPRQVRHVPTLPDGRWPAQVLAPILLTALAGALTAPGLRAETNLAQCNRWQRSHGVSRIELANQIGGASYLTKMYRLQQSPPEAPIALYAESDLERACEGAR